MLTATALCNNLPDHVRIIDVCPRDGLQNLKTFVPTETKKRIIDALLDTGVKYIEATSFVSSKAVPQMADAAEIAAYALEKASPDTHISALAPNMRGARAAWDAGIREISFVMSVSESHNKANINRTCQQSLETLAEVLEGLPDMRVTAAFAVVFGCPFEGEVPLDRTLGMLEQAAGLGIKSVTLSDTIGVAIPTQVFTVVETVRSAFPQLDIGLHMHDTHGMGAANAFAALLAGVTRFDSATGGLGGCPFAPGAAGNTATEDLVNMFERMGVRTGIRLDGLVSLAQYIRNEGISPVLTSHLSSARSYEEYAFWRQVKG